MAGTDRLQQFVETLDPLSRSQATPKLQFPGVSVALAPRLISKNHTSKTAQRNVQRQTESTPEVRENVSTVLTKEEIRKARRRKEFIKYYRARKEQWKVWHILYYLAHLEDRKHYARKWRLIHRDRTTYLAMIRRCYNTKDSLYHYYGARGIRVCSRWMDAAEGYQNFILDMGQCPSPKFSIDRIDNNGDYCPENCRWATRQTQNRNTRFNRFLRYAGKRLCVSEWSEKLGMNRNTLFWRLRNGWSVRRAIEAPVRERRGA